MSLRLFENDVLFIQRLLAAEGLYEGELDGIWGPLTERAAVRFEHRTGVIREQMQTFDLRSESQLSGLLLAAQRAAREFLAHVLDAGILARIISGTRGYAEQNALFRRGRYGNPGPRVTNARGGQSFHNFGLAWDIGIFARDGRYLIEAEPYERAAEAGLASTALLDTVEWGGDNPRFVDRPHYQLRTGLSHREVLARFEAGVRYLPADGRPRDVVA